MTETPKMSAEALTQLVIDALEDMKALDIKTIDVQEKTVITDIMIVASGTSTRHVKSIAENVILKAKQIGLKPLGSEGEKSCEWMLVDLNDVVVHVMLPTTRDFYNLEKLWEMPLVDSESATLS